MVAETFTELSFVDDFVPCAIYRIGGSTDITPGPPPPEPSGVIFTYFRYDDYISNSSGITKAILKLKI